MVHEVHELKCFMPVYFFYQAHKLSNIKYICWNSILTIENEMMFNCDFVNVVVWEMGLSLSL